MKLNCGQAVLLCNTYLNHKMVQLVNHIFLQELNGKTLLSKWGWS